MRYRDDFLNKLGMYMKENKENVVRPPLVEICGCRRVLIENHLSILIYEENRICVKVHFGTIVVSGLQLRLCRVNKEQLIICGQIHGVTMKRSNE